VEDFVFTNDQSLTIDTFTQWMPDESQKYMVIQGAAGTGKSTLIKHLALLIQKYQQMCSLLVKKNQNGEEFEVNLAATTNPAVAVLEDLTGMAGSTIHALLGLRVINDYATGKKKLIPTRDSRELSNRIIILDEASMIDDNLWEMIDSRTPSCKILIIGDKCQLAPVNQVHTVMDYISGPRAEMNQIMRNGGSIAETGAGYRDTVDTGIFPMLPDNCEAIMRVSGKDFKRRINEAFTDPLYGFKTAKVLAWTNAKVNGYNAYIRAIKGLPVDLQPGETVLTNKPILARGFRRSVDSTVVIHSIEAEKISRGIRGHMVKIENKAHSGFLPNNPSEVKALLNKLVKSKNWQDFFHVQDEWYDFRQPYASTVHKAQGSTYDKVFIDLADISKCQVSSDVARMLYVSISRARTQVILHGKMSPLYEGLVSITQAEHDAIELDALMGVT